MPSHHRVKNVAYDDDDYYDYDDEEEYYATSTAATTTTTTDTDTATNTSPDAPPPASLDPDDPSNGLTPEDRAALRAGAAEARQLLRALDEGAGAGEGEDNGVAGLVTDAQVWGALWEFYYDVDASVAWLREQAEKERGRRAAAATDRKAGSGKQDKQDKQSRPRNGVEAYEQQAQQTTQVRQDKKDKQDKQ
ncbi:hypothetical protein KEM52_002439, partial [Ascosphaera acerosa]